MSKEETTSVQEVEVDLDELLGTGASAVMLPEEGSKEKKSIFSPVSADTTFLDKPPVDETTSVEEKTPEELEAEANKTPEEIQAEEVLAKEDVLAPPTDDLDLSEIFEDSKEVKEQNSSNELEKSISNILNK